MPTELSACKRLIKFDQSQVSMAAFKLMHLRPLQPLQRSPFIETHAGVALQVISNHYGNDFVCFLKTDPSIVGAVPADSMRHTISLDMPWTERSLLMDAIDELLLPDLKRGARVAYLLVFGA